MNKYGYKEVRTLSKDNLRLLCISKDWYTLGDCEEYENLLDMTRKDNITTDDIVEIASDIMEHSEDINDREFKSYCFEILKICTTFITES